MHTLIPLMELVSGDFLQMDTNLMHSGTYFQLEFNVDRYLYGFGLTDITSRLSLAVLLV